VLTVPIRICALVLETDIEEKRKKKDCEGFGINYNNLIVCYCFFHYQAKEQKGFENLLMCTSPIPCLLQPAMNLSFSLGSLWPNWVFDSDICGWPSPRSDE